MTVLRSGSASDVGRVRTVNEDLALESLTLFAVADGMGGHAGGEVAARTAIDTLESQFGRRPSVDGLVDAVQEANRAVFEQGRSDPELHGMGTTLIAAALVDVGEGDRLVLANVGDSRAYRLHRGRLEQLTTDHSVAEELVARGELSEAEAAVHPHRHILTRALGVAPDIDVDVLEYVPEEGDRFLLCSDGLTNEVPQERITSVLATTRDPDDAAGALVDLANDAGGNDNITVLVLDVLVGEDHDGVAGVAVARPGTPQLMGRTEVADAEVPTGPPASQAARRKGPRRITFRVLLFVVLLAGLVVLAWVAIRWYVGNSYFVAIDHGQVVIYRGRPGGFAGIEPTVVRRTDINSADVPSYRVSDLQSGVEETSLRAADTYVANLRQETCSLVPAPASCPPPTTTTTTVPKSATTTHPSTAPSRSSASGLGPLPAPWGTGASHPVARAGLSGSTA